GLLAAPDVHYILVAIGPAVPTGFLLASGVLGDLVESRLETARFVGLPGGHEILGRRALEGFRHRVLGAVHHRSLSSSYRPGDPVRLPEKRASVPRIGTTGEAVFAEYLGMQGPCQPVGDGGIPMGLLSSPRGRGRDGVLR